MWWNQLFDISLHFRMIQCWKMDSSGTFFSALRKRWRSSIFRTLRLCISTLKKCFVIWSTHWFECVCEYSCWVMLELLRIERGNIRHQQQTCQYSSSYATTKQPTYLLLVSIHCPLSHRILLSHWRCYCNISSRGTRGIETNVQFQSLATRLTQTKEKIIRSAH